MYSFNIEYVRAGPLRQQMEDMRKIVAEKEAELKIKKESLQAINDKIQELESAFREKVKLKDELTRKITDCELKKDRAEKQDEVGRVHAGWLELWHGLTTIIFANTVYFSLPEAKHIGIHQVCVELGALEEVEGDELEEHDHYEVRVLWYVNIEQDRIGYYLERIDHSPERLE